MSARNLLVFNLATDADDLLLAFASDWLNALAAHFDQIDVITMRAGRLELAPNVTIHSLGKEAGASEALRLWRFYHILLRCLRRRHYVGCFAHMQPLFAALAGPVLHIRGVPPILWYAHSHVPWRLRIAGRFVRRIFTPTSESCRLTSEKLRVVEHGINTAHFQPAPPVPAVSSPFTLLYVGRLDPVKRLEILLAAAAILAERASFAWRFHIVGEAGANHRDYEARLHSEAAARFGERVRFLGPRAYAELPAIYQNADLLWSASGTGSLDKVLLEAMSCCLPILTNNEAAIELLGPWAEALLIPPAASPEEAARLFATRALHFREQSARARRQLGSELRQAVVEQHDLQDLARRIAAEFSA